MKILRFVALILIITSFTGCRNQGQVVEQNQYQQISQDEAKNIMDTDKNAIILDVRTADEHNEGYIEGAICIPHEEINELAPQMISDKNALILVYCRTGRRSKIAAQALADMGYTNVKEFGGIEDWKYGIAK